MKTWINSKPIRVTSAGAYDLVLNGIELGGGSSIYQPDVQQRVFKAIGLTPAKQNRNSASSSGPSNTVHRPMEAWLRLGPHDHALALQRKSIRDVIAFRRRRTLSIP